MKFRAVILSIAMAVGIQSAHAEDVVRLGNLKFAHYGAVSYMKEIAPEFGLKVEERIFAKGLDIMPAILAGEIDVAASALDAAIAGRSGGAPIYVVAGFAKGASVSSPRKRAAFIRSPTSRARKSAWLAAALRSFCFWRNCRRPA